MSKSEFAQEYEERQRYLDPLQDDPGWREWLSFQDIGLAHFFTNVVPDMPADPYSREGLVHAEAAALRLFPDLDAIDDEASPDNRLLIHPFQRYIGEVFVRCFEGRWVYADVDPEFGREPTVDLPFNIILLNPRLALGTLVHERRGDELSYLFDQQHSNYDRWVAAGRPDYPTWAELDLKQLIEDSDRALMANPDG